MLSACPACWLLWCLQACTEPQGTCGWQMLEELGEDGWRRRLQEQNHNPRDRAEDAFRSGGASDFRVTNTSPHLQSELLLALRPTPTAGQLALCLIWTPVSRLSSSLSFSLEPFLTTLDPTLEFFQLSSYTCAVQHCSSVVGFYCIVSSL